MILSDSVMGNNVKNTLFLSYLTFKIFSFNMQKDFHLTVTATVFDKILCWNQGIKFLLSWQNFLNPHELFSSL